MVEVFCDRCAASEERESEYEVLGRRFEMLDLTYNFYPFPRIEIEKIIDQRLANLSLASSNGQDTTLSRW